MLKHGRNQAEQVTKGVGLDLGGSYNRGTPVFGDRRVQVEKCDFSLLDWTHIAQTRPGDYITLEKPGLGDSGALRLDEARRMGRPWLNLVALPNVYEIITLPT